MITSLSIFAIPLVMLMIIPTVFGQEFNDEFEIKDDEDRSINIMDVCTEYEEIISKDPIAIQKFDPYDIENCERILDRDIDGINN